MDPLVQQRREAIKRAAELENADLNRHYVIWASDWGEWIVVETLPVGFSGPWYAGDGQYHYVRSEKSQD